MPYVSSCRDNPDQNVLESVRAGSETFFAEKVHTWGKDRAKDVAQPRSTINFALVVPLSTTAHSVPSVCSRSSTLSMSFRGSSRGRGRGGSRGGFGFGQRGAQQRDSHGGFRGRGRGRGRGGRGGRGGHHDGSRQGRDRSDGRQKNAKPGSSTDLFADVSSSDDEGAPATGADGAPSFRINEEYAKRFEDRARRRALWEAKQRGLMENLDDDDSDASTSESEDEGDALTPALDLEIMKTIQMIRDKDPRIYDPKSEFYRADVAAASETQDKSSKKPKPLRAKDVIRQQVLEAAASGKSDAFADDEALTVGKARGNQDVAPVQAYDQEQKALRAAFTKTVAKEFGEGDKPTAAAKTSDSDSDDDLFAVKEKTQADANAEQADYEAFLGDHRDKVQLQDDEKAVITRFFSQKTEDENEQFLRDYVLNRKWAQGEQELVSYVAPSSWCLSATNSFLQVQ